MKERRLCRSFFARYGRQAGVLAHLFAGQRDIEQEGHPPARVRQICRTRPCIMKSVRQTDTEQGRCNVQLKGA